MWIIEPVPILVTVICVNKSLVSVDDYKLISGPAANQEPETSQEPYETDNTVEGESESSEAPRLISDTSNYATSSDSDDDDEDFGRGTSKA